MNSGDKLEIQHTLSRARREVLFVSKKGKTITVNFPLAGEYKFERRSGQGRGLAASWIIPADQLAKVA